MPIYEYQCQACDQQFEKFFRSLSRVSVEVSCPLCGSSAVQRLMSAPVIQSAGRPAPDSGAAAAESSPSSAPPVFGRKELNQALEQKRQLKEQASYEAKAAKKKV